MDPRISRITALLKLLDEEAPLPRSLQLRVLEQILELDPSHGLARELHERNMAMTYPLDARAQCMVEVEWLAANGATRLAREGAESIRDTWADDVEVQSWFAAITRLLDRQLWEERAPATAA